MESKVSKDPVVAIAGVTGAVGAEFIATMDRRGFRVGKLKALASARSAGKTLQFRGERPITEHEVRAMLSGAPSLKIVDDRQKNYFPMPIDASGQDDVLVGRIRRDLSDPTGHSISMFSAADQLLKGAALNAVQIAELLPQRVMA
jgi:aspartate-semialdehyde dehydrogenase